MTTGAITDAIATREAAPPAISEDEAIETLLDGARLGAYKLPDNVTKAVTGRAALRARYAGSHSQMNAAAEALAGAADRLALQLALAVTSAGSIPKATEPGAAISALEADLEVLHPAKPCVHFLSLALEHRPRAWRNALDRPFSVQSSQICKGLNR